VGVIVDTSVLVSAERGTFDMARYGATVEAGDLAISAITASELLHGVERTHDPALRAERTENVNDVLDAFQVIPFGLDEARRHAQVWAHLKGAGKMIAIEVVGAASEADAVTVGRAVARERGRRRRGGRRALPVSPAPGGAGAARGRLHLRLDREPARSRHAQR